jgi:hypothetical protein
MTVGLTAILLLVVLPLSAQATATVDVLWSNGTSSTVVDSAGSTNITANIFVTTGPWIIGSYGISLEWDPTALTPIAADCVLGGCPNLNPDLFEALPPGFTFNVNNGINSLSAGAGQALTWEAISFGPGGVGTFFVGSISFHVENGPDTTVDPGFWNAGVDGMSSFAGGTVPVNFNSASVIHQTPEPASAALLGLGLLGLGLAGWRARR